MSNISVTFDGKYNALLNGFTYRNGRKHPKFNWIEETDTESIIQEFAALGDILSEEFLEYMADELKQAYIETIKAPKVKTINWYDCEGIINSVKVEVDQ